MSTTTIDHNAIRSWAEDRNMKPAVVTADGKDTGLLRFTTGHEDDLKEVTWEHFFDLFEENELALVHETDTNFNKLISRDEME